MKHVDIARTDGPAAGLRAYKAKLERFGPGTAQAAALEELLRAGEDEDAGYASRDDVFHFYCEKFLSNTAPKAKATQVDARAALLAELDEIDDEDEDGVQVVASDDRPGILDAVRREVQKRSGKGTTKSTTKRNGALGVGTTFTYKGTTQHVIVGEGKTKRGKDAWLCRNPKGKVNAWNKKSVNAYIEKGIIAL